jgi:hypothetical protein
MQHSALEAREQVVEVLGPPRYPSPVLPTPEQPRKSSIARISIIYGSILVVVVGVAVGLLVLLHGNNGSPQAAPSSSPSQAPPVGNFSFTVHQVKVVPTGKTAGTQAAGTAAAKNIERTMDGLYFTGYLDPSAWQTGNYANAWKLFAKEAQAKAHTHVSVLTLGSDAGSKYSAVAAGANTAFVKVLMDRAGHAATAVVTVRFTAKGTGKDGSTSLITSSGDYFLIPGAGGWKITGYDVKQRTA